MKIKNIIKYLPTVIFCGFIFAFAIFYFVLPKSNYSAQEKRKLSDFPEFTVEKLADGTFQSGIDDYLSDHMTARNFNLLQAETALRESILAVTVIYSLSQPKTARYFLKMPNISMNMLSIRAYLYI